MPLSSTITTLAGMMDHCRLRLDDIVDAEFEENGVDTLDDHLLWSNNELVLFANQAVYEVALRSRCIKDNTQVADFSTFAIVSTDTGWVSLSDLWLSIHRVTWINGTDSNIERLDRVMERRLDREVADWQSQTSDDPRLFVLNESSRDMRIYPLVDIDGTLRIEGSRLPKTTLAANADVPEVAAHYLPEAISWMCHLAYMKNDADTKDPNQSKFYEGLFTQRFGERPNANQIECNLHQAQSHRPKTHYR